MPELHRVKLPKVLATIMGTLVATVGVVGIVAPATLLQFGQSLQTPGTLYVVAFGVERSLAMLGWFSSQGPLFMQAWASLAVIFGLVVVYVLNSSGRSAA